MKDPVKKMKLRAIIAREALAIENGIASDTILVSELIKRRRALNAAIDTLIEESIEGYLLAAMSPKIKPRGE